MSDHRAPPSRKHICSRLGWVDSSHVCSGCDDQEPSLRDKFAMGALPVMGRRNASSAKRLARRAYEIADAMLEEKKAREAPRVPLPEE